MPLIVLPEQFKGTTLSAVAADVVGHVDDKGQWPETMMFDFSDLNFIRPAGVAFRPLPIRGGESAAARD
jgi:hypothetical protein